MPLKLPDLLSGFRRKPAADAAPPVEQAPAPIPSQQDTTAPGRLDRLNRWLTLAANLGVLLGLIMLIVEVRQNAALSRAAMEQQKNDVLAEIEFYIAKPEISEVWIKSIRHPEDLTEPELRTMDGILVALMLQWDHRFQMESAGLASRADARQHVLNSAPYYFGSRFAKHWWSLQAPGWEGTPMMEVAGPIVEGLDENFLVTYLDKLKLPPKGPPAEIVPSNPEATE
ncbi:MAG: hypothetical protein VR75_02350 [Hyphomonadaceae bacterium BRH_c29]|nr:MAG: hypothetical protein VR75_02350 [Hyphomonadaceae bacterium BRH_c29]